ncbi:MAG: hypothetical protein HQK57_03540 [Deltaproteobacteria bacterium]|nr:hypothetical protein [Deltaproteobacteria bacterium]MBF0524931.1 hypothetical protein [Deltaproteobacteria bacterium]
MNGKCPLCDWPEAKISLKDTGGAFEVICMRCGDFYIEKFALKEAKRRGDGPKLSAWIRGEKERCRPTRLIEMKNIYTILDSLPSYNNDEKQLLLMETIKRRTPFRGAQVAIDLNIDFPLAWALNPEEFEIHLNKLNEQDLIALSGDSRGNTRRLKISDKGWEYIYHHGIYPDIVQVFVAMWFDGKMNAAYEHGIKPAIEEAGYKSYRIDKEPHIERIDAKMIAEIKNSKFVVAEVTGEKPNVYFEAGYAMAINRPVIFCAKKGETIHFDTQMLPHIIWEKPEELKEKLFYTICAVFGRKEKAKV